MYFTTLINKVLIIVGKRKCRISKFAFGYYFYFFLLIFLYCVQSGQYLIVESYIFIAKYFCEGVAVYVVQSSNQKDLN